jgi:PAS domain S-box-containing protein
MDLQEFSRQIETMQARLAKLSPINGSAEGELREAWEVTTEALGVTMEEMRVAEEELYTQNHELEESRRQVEEERHRYRELFDFAPDGYLVTDLNGLIREANRAAGELLGVSPRHLSGKPLAAYISMDERAGFRFGLNRLLKVGRRDEWIIRLEPRRGRPYDAAVTVAVVRDSHGTPTGLRWLLREVVASESPSPVGRAVGRVTIGLARRPEAGGELEAERRARARAEDEAAALRSLLLGIDLIVWEADAQTGRYWFMSPHAERLLAYPIERWIDDPRFWAGIIHPDDRPLVESQRMRCLRDGNAGELEYRVFAADGRVVWLREALSLELDEAGNPHQLRGCLWDITRRKRVERQLYTDRRKLAEHLADVWHLYLLAGPLLASLELAPKLEEILTSTAALLGAEMGTIRLLDRDRDELEAVVSLNLPQEYLERFDRVKPGVEACGMAVKEGGPVIIGDVEAEAADPARWAESARAGGFRACFSVPLVGRNGELLGTIATFFKEPHRPSERQLHLVENYVIQAADAIGNARTHQAVREADRRKSEFLATLAHELRNPLSAIHTASQLLRQEALDAEMLAEVRDVIARQTGHMARLVEDLLDVTRISRGTMSLRLETVELAEVLKRAVACVRPMVADRGHELTVSLPAGPMVLRADPTRLEQVFANLLTNAAKYTDPGGRIELAASREPGALVVRVSDTGIGLTPEALPGLFQPFTQVDAGQSRSGGGLGIGLALVKSLVELHGGSISAHSDGPGRGSVFEVRLKAD